MSDWLKVICLLLADIIPFDLRFIRFYSKYLLTFNKKILYSKVHCSIIIEEGMSKSSLSYLINTVSDY